MNTLKMIIWLFPIAFMLHDFEEILFMQDWLDKHGRDLRQVLPRWAAGWIAKAEAKSTGQFAFSVLLIYLLVVAATLLAALGEMYFPFLAASAAFVVQAAVLRRYLPALLTSLAVILPYGFFLYRGLLISGIVTFGQLLLYQGLGLLLTPLLIAAGHLHGDAWYEKLRQVLVE